MQVRACSTAAAEDSDADASHPLLHLCERVELDTNIFITLLFANDASDDDARASLDSLRTQVCVSAVCVRWVYMHVKDGVCKMLLFAFIHIVNFNYIKPNKSLAQNRWAFRF